MIILSYPVDAAITPTNGTLSLSLPLSLNHSRIQASVIHPATHPSDHYTGRVVAHLMDLVWSTSS